MFKSRNFLILFGLAIVVALPCSLVAQDEPAAEGSKLKPTVVVQEKMDEGSLTDKVSYYMGYNIIKNFMQQGQEIDKEMMFKGMEAAAEDSAAQKSYFNGYEMMKRLKAQGGDLTLEKMKEGMNLASEGKELDMSEEEVQAMMVSFTGLIRKKKADELKKKTDDNVAATKAYMAENAKNPAVKELPNGVQYEVLVPGTGASPAKTDVVKVDYHGTLFDGTVFDSTIKHPSGRPAKPAEFPVAGVVPGFSAALQAMKVGGKWKVVIPGELAYGVRGRGKIGPSQALIFELSLLDIVTAPQPGVTPSKPGVKVIPKKVVPVAPSAPAKAAAPATPAAPATGTAAPASGGK